MKKIFLIMNLLICLAIGLPLRAQTTDIFTHGLPMLKGASEMVQIPIPLERAIDGIIARTLLESGQGKFQNSVFYARHKSSNLIWSGTVFAVKEGMQREIYGVIPAHALAIFPSDFIKEAAAESLLRRDFQVNMFDRQGFPRVLPGKVVWLSSPYTWDLALVKFEVSDEALFTPFELSSHLPSVGDKVQQLGFSDSFSIYIPDQKIIGTAPYAFRTALPAGSEQHVGLGGSPVFTTKTDEKNEETHQLVGVYIEGERGETPAYDIGYFAPNRLLNQLVEDYRSGGKMQIPVLCQGRELFSLAPNEHIQEVNLFDSNGIKIKHQKFKPAFSSQKMEMLLDAFKPEEAEFLIKRFQWHNPDSQYADFSKRNRKVRYNFRQGYVVEQ